jgi:hypothetical protein
MGRTWTAAAMEYFRVDGRAPTTAQALREHCERCGVEAPEGLREDLIGRVVCNVPDLTEAQDRFADAAGIGAQSPARGPQSCGRR